MIPQIAIDSKMIFHPVQKNTGIGICTRLLHEELSLKHSREFNFHFLTDHHNKNNPDFIKLQFPMLNGRYIWENTLVPAYLKKNKINLYHAMVNFNLPILKLTKYILTVHDIIPILYPESVSYRYAKLFKAYLTHSIKVTDHIITVSDVTKNALIEHFRINPDKITTIHNGINTEYEPLEKSDCIEILRQKYKVRGPYVFSLPGFAKHKNVELLIRSFTSFAKQGIHLVIGGIPFPHPEPLTRLIENYNLKDKVHIISKIDSDHLNLFYSGAEAFVIPSIYEGFGLPLLEAMACGTPVISSTGGALKEIGGDNAFYFDPSSSDELKNSLNHAISNFTDKESFLQKASAHASCFTWEKAALQYTHAYQKLL